MSPNVPTILPLYLARATARCPRRAAVCVFCRRPESDQGQTAGRKDARHHGLGFGRDGAFEQFRVEVHRDIIHVHINRLCTDVGNRPARRDERERRGDDLVARPDVEQHQRNVQRGRAAVETDAVFRADEPAKSFSNWTTSGSEAERAVVEGARDGGVQFLAARCGFAPANRDMEFCQPLDGQPNPAGLKTKAKIIGSVSDAGYRAILHQFRKNFFGVMVAMQCFALSQTPTLPQLQQPRVVRGYVPATEPRRLANRRSRSR